MLPREHIDSLATTIATSAEETVEPATNEMREIQQRLTREILDATSPMNDD